MPGNPIPAIEDAELAAERRIEKANEFKAALIGKTREKASGDLEEAVRKAREESKRIIQAAEKASMAEIAAMDSKFKKERSALRQKAINGESAAIGAIIGIIGGKTS